MKIAKVISGGQTGVDQAGLFAAADLNIATGGHAPKGWRTQKGPAKWLEDYGLIEHSSPNYPPRTRLNVQSADLTIILGDHTSPGCKLTRRYCHEHEKPYIIVNYFNDNDFVSCYRTLTEKLPDDLVVNIAGNREESTPGIEKKATKFLKRLFSKVNEI